MVPIKGGVAAAETPGMTCRTTAMPCDTDPAPAAARDGGAAPVATPAPADGAPMLVWNATLDTGLEDVDREHRRLVDILNALARQRSAGAGAAVLRMLCDELKLYAQQHFAQEESLLDEWAVDAGRADAHRRAHAAFVARIAHAATLIDADPQAVVDHLLSFLVKWLVHHIRGVDAALAREITALQCGGAAPPPGDAVDAVLVDTVSDLYDSLGERTLALVDANARLRHEISRRESIEAALRSSEERFARLYRFAPVALWEIDWSGVRRALRPLTQAPAGAAAAPTPAQAHAQPRALRRAVAAVQVLDVNDAARQQAGLAAGARIGGRAALAALEPGLPMLARTLAALAAGETNCSGEFAFRRTDGALRDLAFNVVTMPDAAQRGRDLAVVVTLDVTERKQAMEQLQHRSLHDPLTGLPNRVLLTERLQQAMARARRARERAAVLFVDLDGFKPINDGHGHAAGDALLVALARRLRGCVRASDTVARIGGDEFALVLGAVGDAAQALAVADKIRHAVARPCTHDGRPLRVSASIGVAVFPDHGATERVLLRRADAAMYAAKAAGRDRVHLHDDAGDTD